MVSFWPWKSNDTSPASFEKSLSAIAKKITSANTRLESSRQQSRRFKALWTLYTSIAYLLYAMIIGLVVGLKSAGMVELGGLLGGPFVIYGVRQAITSFYAYRTSKQQAYLESLQKQRDSIIKKLKDATKYDSTQQLLEKYGGTPAKPKKNPSNNATSRDDQRRIPPTNGRTMLIPPPTANIPRGPLSAPNTPEKRMDIAVGSQPPLTAAAATPPWAQQNPPISPGADTAEFAPNAFPPANYYAQPGSEYGGGRWYDRFMDVLLGEDELHPKNRIVLICQKCRLVNGQAPPGVRSLADIGRWRCSACGTMNGEETEVQKIVAEIENEKTVPSLMKSVEEEDGEEAPVLVERYGNESDATQSSGDEKGKQTGSTSTGRETRSAKARKARKHDD